MKWKKFKKERISLNYTVMLLPHSQKEPIHFKTPVWTFGIFFLALLVLTGTCLFFAGSHHQLSVVQKEKEHLEREWELLEAQKELEDQENEMLRQAREEQELALKELEQKTRDTLHELEELVAREDQIRQELGLQQSLTEGAGERQGEEQEGSQEDIMALESTSGSYQPGDAQLSANQTIKVTSKGLSAAMAKNTSDFRSIQSELNQLQNSLSEKTGQYDSYLSMIEEKRAAEEAEKARREAVRTSIVDYALQFVGNAYVYGGNDPHTGVDCSGFTRYVLSHSAGVYLNRTAASQSSQGKSINAEEARPGDLVFYSGGGGINHVAIYIGNGRIVHASTEKTGIITSNMYYRTPVKIVNMLGD